VSHFGFRDFVSHDLQSNIVVNDEGKASLIDFGLALTLQATGFTTPMASGCMRYLAPERVNFANVEDKVIPRATKGTDLWAFAMTVVEVCISNSQLLEN
jgi:serine/threonine protein kinase